MSSGCLHTGAFKFSRLYSSLNIDRKPHVLYINLIVFLCSFHFSISYYFLQVHWVIQFKKCIAIYFQKHVTLAILQVAIFWESWRCSQFVWWATAMKIVYEPAHLLVSTVHAQHAYMTHDSSARPAVFFTIDSKMKSSKLLTLVCIEPLSNFIIRLKVYFTLLSKSQYNNTVLL